MGFFINYLLKSIKNNMQQPIVTNNAEYKDVQVSKILSNNIEFINAAFSKCDDVIIKNFSIPSIDTKVAVVYIDAISNSELINEHIINPLEGLGTSGFNTQSISTALIKKNIIAASSTDESSSWEKLISELADGNVLLFLDNSDVALIIYAGIKIGRQSGEVTAEQTLRGSKEAFVENIKNNIALIRKRIKSPNLAIEIIKIGKQTNQSTALIYVKGIIKSDIPVNIKKEIEKINIDGVITSAQIEDLIQKHKWTFLPQMLATERPDNTVKYLLDGRAALIVDGTPFVLIIPTTFGLFFKSADDYTGRTFIYSLLRLLRYFTFIVSISFSATYIALTSFHPGLLATPLLLSITSTRIEMPFPTIVEVLFMEITLYLIQEAAVRVPKPLGLTVGIVGGLVIGQSVVSAGLVSPIIVIIMSLTAISSFALPNYTFTLSTIVMRIIVIFFASTLGFYGLAISWILLIIHAASLENFGVKYLEDFSPFKLNKLKRLVKSPQHLVKERPDYLDPENYIKQQLNKGKDKQDE